MTRSERGDLILNYTNLNAGDRLFVPANKKWESVAPGCVILLDDSKIDRVFGGTSVKLKEPDRTFSIDLSHQGAFRLSFSRSRGGICGCFSRVSSNGPIPPDSDPGISLEQASHFRVSIREKAALSALAAPRRLLLLRRYHRVGLASCHLAPSPRSVCSCDSLAVGNNHACDREH
jgi:hypothetical protein